MTVNFALEYIPRRMNELGYGNEYHLRLKYLTFGPLETKTLEAYNQLVIVIDIGYYMKIESDMGVIDWVDNTLKEYQYEHTGPITLTNKWEGFNSIQFIQVIPKKKLDAGK